nr:uncharacterized protein LOC133615177 isoform X3 [Nerophis lumbriciformis]
MLTDYLGQLDVLPFRSERLAVRSRLNQEAVSVLEARTKRVKVGDTLRYTTPLLRVKGAPPLKADVEAVMPKLRSTERRLLKDTVKAKIYEAEIQKLIDGGCVTKLQEAEGNRSTSPRSNPRPISHRAPPAVPPAHCRHQWRYPSHVPPSSASAGGPAVAEEMKTSCSSSNSLSTWTTVCRACQRLSQPRTRCDNCPI